MVAKAILLLFVTIAYGYNVDTRFPIIYSSGNTLEDRGSYYGYTVHLYHEPVNDVSWLIIGAPRGNYSWSTRQGPRPPTEPGVVFRCMINGKTCHEIKPQKIGNEKGYISQLQMDVLIKKQYGWFGSAMSIDESNGMLTVCAPRTIVSIFEGFLEDYWDTMQGMCYSGMISSNTLLLEEENLGSHDFRSNFWYNPMHGFSVHYASAERSGGNTGKKSNRIVGEPNHETFGTVDIHHSSKRISVELALSDELSKFGFSAESGYFFDRNQLLYVSGAPGWEYMGLVAIINPTIDAPIVGKLHGTSFGEFFGASLAVGDLDNDGLDDLMVGAPYWGQDNGKVYIYFGTEKGQFGAVTLLQGAVEGGHFGYAIASGDLDADGFNDIIVGAPWEESGVIYIYNGGSGIKDKKLQASQRIEARNVFLLNTSPKVERFGFSISKPVDIDGNGYLDLAVGAYKSGHAIVLRSKPVVETEVLIRTVPNVLERDAQQFLIEICLRYDGYNIHSEQATDQKITITLDEQYQRTKETFLELRSSNLTSMCLETLVNVSRNIRDFIEPISIFAEHKFADNISSNRFCKLCPIERKFNKLNTAKVLLPFNIGCGIDTVCNSNISATAKFHGVRDNDAWVIGSTDINLEINLSNHGEPAYLTTLEFVFPEGILLRSILPSCQEDTSKKNLIVACDVGNPLWKEERNVKLDLDMRHFINGTLHNQKLNFYITIKSRSTNQGTVNVTKTLTLVSEVSLSLNGKANEESYYFFAINNNNSIISFQHTYQVYKLGATPIEDAQLIIKVPMAIKDSEPLMNLYKPQLYVSGDVFECSSEDVLLDTEVTEVQEESTSDEFEMQVSSNKMQPNGDHERRERDINEPSIEFYNTKDVKASQITNTSSMNDVRYMNCSNPDVNCTTIVCDLSALKTLQDIGKVPIKFLLNVQRLKDTFANNGTVLKFGTEASVEIMKPALRLPINGTRSTMEIVTMFYKAPNMEKLQLWIILVSISVGLLLLFIFAAILHTLGFFKRKGKQDFMNDENTEGTTAAIELENE